MKGHYEPERKCVRAKHGKIHRCDHPLYSRCTLYFDGEVGLAVVQMRFNDHEKIWWWGPVDPWLVEDIFSNENFEKCFKSMAGRGDNGIYPTVEVRKLMYALDMKPMKKEYWEKGFKS